MKTHLRVEFNLAGAQRCVYVDDLKKVQNGFWVDSKYELATPATAKLWVPPSKLVDVTKESKSLPQHTKRK